jgi:hypothetical protein
MNFKIIQLLLSVFMIAKLSFVSSQSQFCFSSHEGGTVSVACSSGLIIAAVNFASYGTPTGTCGAYNTSSCHAPSSYSLMANACVNQPSCTFDANSKVFGDQCDGDFKRDEQLKPSIVPTYLISPTSDPSSSPTTVTPSATPSTLLTRMITNDDFIQAAQVGDLTRLKKLIAEWKVTGDFNINATNKVSL